MAWRSEKQKRVTAAIRFTAAAALSFSTPAPRALAPHALAGL